MKINPIILGIVVSAIGFTSCETANQTEDNDQSESQTEVSSEEPNDEVNLDELDALRADIEELLYAPVEISTAGLKEKIKQKWSKLHFYVENGQVVKVKSYPYPEISKRTEEYYAKDNELFLVVIEDNGDTGIKGRPKSEIDKMYYFNNGKLIKEIKKEEKSEFTIKESDAEELLSEFNEYLQIYKVHAK